MKLQFERNRTHQECLATPYAIAALGLLLQLLEAMFLNQNSQKVKHLYYFYVQVCEFSNTFISSFNFILNETDMLCIGDCSRINSGEPQNYSNATNTNVVPSTLPKYPNCSCASNCSIIIPLDLCSNVRIFKNREVNAGVGSPLALLMFVMKE